MKKFITFLCCATVALAGCSRLDDLEGKVDELGGRVDKIEEKLAALNEQVSSLDALVQTIKNGGYITEVKEETKDGLNYYTLVLSNGKEYVIHDGAKGIDGVDGADGADGNTPVVGVKLDEEDGEYYWTVNGEYTDPKVRVNGKDGMTPEITIISDYWVIKWPGEEYYTTLGQARGADGKDGDSFFQSVTVGEDEVTFTLADGETFSVSLLGAFRLVCPITTVGVNAGGQAVVAYEVKGVKKGEEVVVYVKYTSEGWAAEIDETKSEVKITVPAEQETGLVIIEAINNTTSMVADQAVRFEKGVLTATTESFEVSDASNTIEVPVSTNMLYEVSVDAEWIKYIETRAPHTETLVFQTELNKDAADRNAVITLKGSTGDIVTVAVLQRGCPPLKESYEIGEFYERQGVVGIVWHDSEDCVKVLALDDKNFVKFATGTTANSWGFSATDGLANLKSIVDNPYSDIKWFPAHEWCNSKGENWYLPAEEEMIAILNNIETLNTALEANQGTTLRKGNFYWTSTQIKDEVANAKYACWDWDYEKAISGTQATTTTAYVRASNIVSRKAPEENPEPSVVLGAKMNVGGADGVVAYIDETGEHGYVISLSECDKCYWAPSSYQYSSWVAGVSSDTDGKSVSSSYSSDYECIYSFPAAYWAIQYGNSGWFLPAKEQLKSIFANFSKVNKGIEEAGGKAMTEYQAYWTITTYFSDDSGLNAYHVTACDGEVITGSDEVSYFQHYARAIHVF